ncbi:ABC-type transport system involved in multi-copper enzyme maturation, permease component (plasmid) [Tsukamurella tyrosinosolvens]|uniref:ABC-2 type transport system permease protein n=1 Tax=Tsukamurella tyrosinosolvens TaxID=57704 RepID=A0A1H4ZVR2_TSUTY|nr:ABC transporter permease [Tsukamurella tyrosinosolvens]KXO95506.1 ABC transporter [Tsukamurella tyrosinosolvens]SED34286.1 ABC-2 type transport system permease protein [Tsukamurella tyrosinosolvens]VEH99542.1 ABC-type transport system involved in multi-copper enzyme maturation, permease component [Tsukamurella tyrosinosolvens]
MTTTTTAPAWGLTTRFLLLDVRRQLRNRQTLIVTTVLPVVLYLALHAQAGPDARFAHGDFGAWMMIGLALYGSAAAATTTAAQVAAERSTGWVRTLRLTPLRPPGYIASKVVSALTMSALPVLVLAALAAATGAQAEPQVWVLSLLIAWLGSALFGALGLALGLALRPEIVMHVPGLLLTVLAFGGNVFFPLSGGMLTVAQCTPMYGITALARYPLTGGETLTGAHTSLAGAVVNVVVWFVVFAGAAALAYRRSAER